MRKKPGKVIGFKVESHRPEDSPKNIAIELAGTLQLEINARADAKAFKEQSTRERQKAQQFTDTMTMLREYNRNKAKVIKSGQEWNPSRMEPMESYDLDMIKEERLMLVERANVLIDEANKCEEIAQEASRQTAKLQQKLMDIK